MQTVALIDDTGTVQNITEVPDEMVIVEAGKYFLPPAGLTPIVLSGDEGAEIGGRYADGVFVRVPDPQSFKLSAYGYLGAAAFAMPLAGYIAPVIDSLNAGNWALARQIVGFARQAQAMTQQQYDDLTQLLAVHHIPEA